MLAQLAIRDFAIVRTLELAFEPGLSVLTGETGAGNSIAVDALTLALGARADADVIRAGANRTEVSASFDIDAQHPAAAWLAARELAADGECILRRIVERDKPSKAFINGQPVPVQALRELGELLVDIHGQHEHQSLLKRDTQRDLLDAFAGAVAERMALGGDFARLRELEARRAQLDADGEARAQRLDLLRYQLSELDALALGQDELLRLEEEQRRLANAQALLQGAQETAIWLTEAEDGAATERLTRAAQTLAQLATYEPRLNDIAARLNEAAIQVEEAARDLRALADRWDLDPARLAEVDARLGGAHSAARKHRIPPAELPTLHARLAEELTALEHGSESRERLDGAIAEQRAVYDARAARLSAVRAAAATKFAKEVTARMRKLGLPEGRFEVALAAQPAPTAHGREQVDFLVSANPGQPPKPLGKVASGGELSRISLALQVVVAGLGEVPTLIFDEVDVGVGGAVADIVGQELHRLARQRQVLCITHLGQVAAKGDRHYQVSKTSDKHGVTTAITLLNAKERVQEIARMIGGVEINPKTLALAKDMLANVPA